jgi:hypothetical protein
LFEGESRNTGPVTRMFDGDATNVAFFINIQECVFVEVASLSHSYRPKLDVQGIGVLEIFNLHGLYDLSKKAL